MSLLVHFYLTRYLFIIYFRNIIIWGRFFTPFRWTRCSIGWMRTKMNTKYWKSNSFFLHWYFIYSSSSPLINDFFNLTRSVEGETVVLIGVSLIGIYDDGELSFKLSVDKRLKKKEELRRKFREISSYDVWGSIISSYFFNFKTIGAGDVCVLKRKV